MKRKELRKEKEEDSILITALYRILCISFKITLQKCTHISVFALTHLPEARDKSHWIRTSENYE